MEHRQLEASLMKVQKLTQHLPQVARRETINKTLEWVAGAYETLWGAIQTYEPRTSLLFGDFESLVLNSREDFLFLVNQIVDELTAGAEARYNGILNALRAAINLVLRGIEKFYEEPDHSESSRMLLSSLISEGKRRISEIELERVGFEVEERADAILQGAQKVVDDIEVKKEEAEFAALKSQEAAGLSGVSSFSRHFQDLAQRHLTLANKFRAWTFVLIVLVAFVALTSVALILIWSETFSDWQALAAKGSLILAVSALATYTSRQASHHRRMADWAESVETQIKSTQGILDAMQDDQDKSHAYKLFVSRVLAPPPDKNPQQVDLVSTAQIMEALSSVMKKSA